MINLKFQVFFSDISIKIHFDYKRSYKIKKEIIYEIDKKHMISENSDYNRSHSKDRSQNKDR